MGDDRRSFLQLAGSGRAVRSPGGWLARPSSPAPVHCGRRSRRAGGPAGRWWSTSEVRPRGRVHRVHRGLQPRPTTSRSFADPKHEVKWIWKEPFADAFPDQDAQLRRSRRSRRSRPSSSATTATTRPACASARLRRPGSARTAIVMMDWHRCIGCRYCMAACPYGSRSFNWEDPRPHIKDLNPDFPDPHQGRGREVHVLRRATRQGATAGVRDGVPGEGDDLRRPQRPRLRGAAPPALAFRPAAQGEPRDSALKSST